MRGPYAPTPQPSSLSLISAFPLRSLRLCVIFPLSFTLAPCPDHDHSAPRSQSLKLLYSFTLILLHSSTALSPASPPKPTPHSPSTTPSPNSTAPPAHAPAPPAQSPPQTLA